MNQKTQTTTSVNLANLNARLVDLFASNANELQGIVTDYVTSVELDLKSHYAADVAAAAKQATDKAITAIDTMLDNRVAISPKLFSRIVNVLAVVEDGKLLETDGLLDAVVTDAMAANKARVNVSRPTAVPKPRVVHGQIDQFTTPNTHDYPNMTDKTLWGCRGGRGTR